MKTENETTHGNVVVQALRRAGVVRFYMYVSGSSDSGDIQVADAYDAQDKIVPLHTLTEVVSYTTKQTDWLGNTTIKDVNDIPLKDAVMHLADNAIENSGVDWYNNEGGAGEYNLNVVTGAERLVMSVNVLQGVFWGDNNYG